MNSQGIDVPTPLIGPATDSMTRPVSRVFLVCLSGSGKSTVGPQLAQRLGLPFIDLDAFIEQQVGRPIREIFESQGEASFRALEREAILDACRGAHAVVATGAGAVMDSVCLDRMRNAGAVVWLDAPLETLAARLAGAHDRPLLTGDTTERLRELAEQRAPLYARSHVRVDASP